MQRSGAVVWPAGRIPDVGECPHFIRLAHAHRHHAAASRPLETRARAFEGRACRIEVNPNRYARARSLDQRIGELPPELINSNLRTKVKAKTTARTEPKSPKTVGNATNQTTGWRVGDRVIHRSFGVGQITHVFGTENKQSVAIKFPNLGQKIIDPKIVGLQKIE